MSRLLALDQSSKITGYAIFNDGELEKHGKFVIEDFDVDIRLMKLRQKLINLIKEEQIDEVVYEDIQQQENVQTFKVLAEVFGVVSELLAEMELPHSTVLAVQWKSTLKIAGSTRAVQKRNAQKYVQDTYSIKATQDECDAICIGVHHLQTSGCAW